VDLSGPVRASLFAEFIANDKPLIASYEGEIYVPGGVDYPEDKFGGFRGRADYRDPYLAEAHRRHGWMIWPPIRFANNTHNLDLPTPAPSPPTWMLSDARPQCKERSSASASLAAATIDLEYNWLGTDDQGRDVVARLIYGFRISVLFGSS
jgi:microcin C transport system permease protein